MMQIHAPGFTLIELLLAMVLAGSVATAMHAFYRTQQKTFRARLQVTAMQQSLRVGMYQMERELRMAGFDPRRTAKAGFRQAGAREIVFTYDRNGNGEIIDSANDPGERLHYALANGALRREVWHGNLQVLAENIEALDLVFLDAEQRVLNPDRGEVPASGLPLIRSVEITMVARTAEPDPDCPATGVYRNQRGDILTVARNDHFRRRMLTTTVRCRNTGL